MTEKVTSQTPPILHGPSEKDRKYDRQLRLWAASGQAALEEANILLLNSGAGTVGVETLKNLILPGIGRFSIADDASVSDADLGVNFFLQESSRGKPRSQCCAELLLELNPEVQGTWQTLNQSSEALGEYLESSPIYTMILYTFPVRPEYQALLETYSRQHKTPVVAIHSAGLYSYFQITLPGAFPIVETHPDETATTDLRLLAPWPELEQFAQELTKDVDNLDDHDHGHLPYVAILLHYLGKWRDLHDGTNPTTYAEKTAFRRMVQDATRRDNPEVGEENFDEAVAAVLKTVTPASLPAGLREVFQYEHAEPTEQKSVFWVIADAVKQFYDKHKCLPVPGSVPDMKAQSKVYVQLQNIYKAKARKDAGEVLELVRTTPAGHGVDPAQVELFCKNAAFVKLVNATRAARSPSEAMDRLRRVAESEFRNDETAEALMTPFSLLPIYLALQATSHVASATETDMLAEITKMVPGAAENERVIKCVREVARAEGGELHNISALTGGMVAQEVIKVITKQYVPIDNTCIFDGISSRCQVLRL